MAPTTFSPVLPPELEREIFEATVYMYPEIVPSLLLVCHRVHDWIIRIRYNTVAPSGLQHTFPFHVLRQLVLSKSKPASFFRDRVHHLFIPHGNSLETRDILFSCSAVQNIAIMLRAAPSVFSDLPDFQPRRLSIRLVPLLYHVNLCRSTFALVTHLHVLDFIPLDSGPHMHTWFSFLSLLPSLTHLAVIIATRVAADIFASCANLQVLIHLENSWGPFPPEETERTFVDDERFVYMVVDWDYPNDWVTGTKGGMNFWARADRFIAMKRRGEIKPASRCWIEDTDGV
ncbi:hypothetical protein R3P38DRAFT_3305899 [Favolaschia claudopus]|uniref:F-box domain-containing protein n=1 Tax=Favolaschia claudopus TaxID=2862362 RepID=A0AAW0DGS3_9AGAR